MIIRSQGKKCIVNLDNIMEIAVRDKKVVCSGSYRCGGLLGIYSTEEKAIKVLDMIEDAHRSMSFTDGVVFRMPADEDVEV